MRYQLIGSSIISGCLLTLPGCALFGGDDHSSSQPVENTHTQTHHIDHSDHQAGGDTTADIELETKKGRVYAHVTTTWGDAQQGALAIKWIPPVKSNCQTSEFVIAKYQQRNDSTWAYRTYQSNLHNCKGVWQAQVISKDGQILSTAEVKAQ